MLKKLVSTLALTGLAFGSGLCFNPYNHDYGISTKQFQDGYLSNYNKTIVLHNGKMRVSKDAWVNLMKYKVNGNKALILIRGKGKYLGNEYFVIYAECTNGKPVTKDVEEIGFPPSTSTGTFILPKYPMQLGFYKDGFWAKTLTITWVNHFSCNSSGCGPGGFACDYETNYYPYKLIKEHKIYDAPFKDHYLPKGLCQVLGDKYLQ
jgi:hypothetical protein